MTVDLWAAVGTIVATLVLFVVPGLVYTWYAIEYLIEDRRSYDHVIARCNGGTVD